MLFTKDFQRWSIWKQFQPLISYLYSPCHITYPLYLPSKHTCQLIIYIIEPNLITSILSCFYSIFKKLRFPSQSIIIKWSSWVTYTVCLHGLASHSIVVALWYKSSLIDECGSNWFIRPRPSAQSNWLIGYDWRKEFVVLGSFLYMLSMLCHD